MMYLRAILVVFFAVGVMSKSYTLSKREVLMMAFRPTCEETGNIDKLDELADAVDDSRKCLESNFDLLNLPNEVRDAMTNGGGLTSVFKRYCAKSSQIKPCAHILRDGVALCMTMTMREFFSSNSADKVIDFVCHNDGERIATYITNGGLRCFHEKAAELNACEQNQQVSSLAEQCAVFDSMSSCMINKLKTCPTSAAANFIESLLQLVRESRSCK